MRRTAVKAAELASGLGAVALGAGLGLFAPATLRDLALPVLAAGLLVHGAGMTLRHRWDAAQADPPAWERALFWLCWVLLGSLAAWLAWAPGSAEQDAAPPSTDCSAHTESKEGHRNHAA